METGELDFANGGRLVVAEVEPPARDQLARTGLLDTLDKANVFAATGHLGESLENAFASA